MTIDLIPCPFCGNSDLLVRYNSSNRVVRCECGVELNGWADTDEEAATSWNNRADFSTVEGKQLISEEAISWLYHNHREVYDQWYELI